jgi:C-terminal processing protease CtpA/Prc
VRTTPHKETPSGFPVLSGIGVALSIRDAGPLVFKVLPDSATEKSGRQHKGDRILSIWDGDRTINLKGKKQGDVVSLVRGPVGTPVTLEILSGDSRSPSLVTLRREAVPVPALTQQST